MKGQRLESGEDSTNMQAGNDIVIYHGVTASEVVKISNETFRASTPTFVRQVQDEIERRAGRIVDDVISALESKGADLTRAVEPNFLHALYVAQCEYAKSGDEKLAELLVDLLITKFGAKAGQLQDIVLSEAIATVGKLTSAQVNALTICWLITKVKSIRTKEIAEIVSRLCSDVAPFVDNFPLKDVDYEHIQYTGCASLGAGAYELGNCVYTSYPGLFQRGITLSAIPDAMWVEELRWRLFRESSRELNCYEVNALTREDAAELIREAGLHEHEHTFLTLFDYALSGGEIESILTESHATLATLVERWSGSLIRTLVLSTVGVAIAHSNWRRGANGETPVSVWLGGES